MKKKILLLLFLTAFTVGLSENSRKQPKKAVTIVPVADLVLQRMPRLFSGKSPWECYQNISLEGAKERTRSCPRVHQLLFNERVEIIRSAGDEVLVKIPHVFYTSGISKKNKYWTHKKNVLPLEALKKKGLNPQLFPVPILFSDKTIEKANAHTITLLFPVKDRAHNRIFSAGTRFVRARTTVTDGPIVKVWAFDPSAVKFNILAIPKHLCLSTPPKSNKKKRQLFVKLLKRWAHLSDGFIPYVWGGCSFTTPYKKNMIARTHMSIKTQGVIPIFWKKKKGTATGFDCAGVIARAAHACNIPYFFKNSSTALQQLKPIVSYKKLAEGDLLYIKGHLMVVSDIKNNKIIEARSHWHGFGKLQEIKLSDEFQGIETYQQLFDVCLAGTTFARLDSAGSVFEKIQSAKLLKLPTS